MRHYFVADNISQNILVLFLCVNQGPEETLTKFEFFTAEIVNTFV
jgi:hypothetical protein